ncbi:MAG: Nucleotidyltransferase domain protein, BT0168 group, partial [uncultured Chloroflexia bacterium]
VGGDREWGDNEPVTHPSTAHAKQAIAHAAVWRHATRRVRIDRPRHRTQRQRHRRSGCIRWSGHIRAVLRRPVLSRRPLRLCSRSCNGKSTARGVAPVRGARCSPCL